MKFPASHINEIVRVTGFDPVNAEKALRLKELLRELGQHSFLKGRLVLKGGTGINVFYLGLPRLSVDIDLNYVGQAELEGMRGERPQVERALGQVGRGLGYEIRPGTNEHALYQIYLGFWNHAGRQDQIELEINFLMRICALPPSILEAARLGGEESCRFPVLAVEELIAGKVKALIERRHPRDLYDAYRFALGRIPHDGELLRKLAVLFGSTLDHDLRQYDIERLDGITQSEVERLLYPLLRADDRPTVDQMMATIRPQLGSVLDHKKESAYLDGMSTGEYRPELLFPNYPGLAARLARHPALLWKAANVKAYRSKTGSTANEES